MQKTLIQKADEFKHLVNKTMQDLGFLEMRENGESMDIVGSVYYGVPIEGESDIDIRITSDKPRESFLKKIAFLSQKMEENKLLKKIVINNFFDDYPIFDKKKEQLLGHKKRGKNFMIAIDYYGDDSLEKKLNFEFHISDEPFEEFFPELIKLNDNQRENLLNLKYFVYKELPFFWNRSYLLYKGFLKGNDTKESIKEFLSKNGYEKLIK